MVNAFGVQLTSPIPVTLGRRSRWRKPCVNDYHLPQSTNMSGESIVAGLALIGIVIVVSALLSGVIDRSGLPQVAVFLAIGAALDPAGLNVSNMTLYSPILRVVPSLSLTLILFTDRVA